MAVIVTVTLNPAIDQSCAVDHVVAEHKLRCHDLRRDPGGGGINVAATIHELGGEATALWICGGRTGEILAELLDKKGITHRPVRVRDYTREDLTVYCESSGEQYRFNTPGAAMSPGEIDSFLETLQGFDPTPDYLVISGSLPPGVDAGIYSRMIGGLPSSCRVIVDTSGEPLHRALDQGVYMIKPNLRELGKLTERELENDEDIESAARQLIDQDGAEVVVVSLGAGGAFFASKDEAGQVRSPTVPIRSKVGAGDSMVGGITFQLSGGASIGDAVRFGVACGAATVMTTGTTMCRRADVERLFEKMR